LNGETYVVSVNEFSAMCSWQVVGVQVEQNRCKDRALGKAVTLGSPRTGVIAHWTDQTVLFTALQHFTRFHSLRFKVPVNSGLRTKRIIGVFYFSKDTMYVRTLAYSILAYAYPRAIIALDHTYRCHAVPFGVFFSSFFLVHFLFGSVRQTKLSFSPHVNCIVSCFAGSLYHVSG